MTTFSQFVLLRLNMGIYYIIGLTNLLEVEQNNLPV